MTTDPGDPNNNNNSNSNNNNNNNDNNNDAGNKYKTTNTGIYSLCNNSLPTSLKLEDFNHCSEFFLNFYSIFSYIFGDETCSESFLPHMEAIVLVISFKYFLQQAQL